MGGIRAGFFLGDGAGVGKGRQIAAIIRDSLCRANHSRRHVWLSVSRELVVDARRDLTDVKVHCPVHDGTDLLDSSMGLGAFSGDLAKGVLFCTYALLVSSKRMEGIVSWAANTDGLHRKTQAAVVRQREESFNGCIVLDEAHKAKNLTADSKTAQLVIELQRRLPHARVVYCSATGVSDVKHMVYAERLGLWNTSLDFSSSSSSWSLYPNFKAFQASLEQRGLGSLEMLALEMKQQGKFMARTLSWDGAEFDTLEVKLNDEQRLVYDNAVRWWMLLKNELEDTLVRLSKMGSQPNRTIWRTYWAAHQRFFKELAICSKVPFVADDAKRAVIEQGSSVIIGLQSTGDAGMQSILEDIVASKQLSTNGCGQRSGDFDEHQFPRLLSTVAAIMKNFVRNHFPVKLSPPEPLKIPDAPPGPTAPIDHQRHYILLVREAARIASLPPPTPIPELVEKRQRIIDSIEGINLPPNPLDDLIERLGGVDQVAEMTGRFGRICRAQGRNGIKRSYFSYSKRGGGSNEDETDRVNLNEKRKFMEGSKNFAIISDAASTGISLHAARGSGASHRRRVHYTIELPWAADKAIQQLGRSHRSGQESAPNYKLVVTDLGGERRFAAAVSKRMQNMGALTKGDRRAATGSDLLSDFDLDSLYGKRALKRFYAAFNCIEQPEIRLSRKSDQILDLFVKQLVQAKDPIVRSLPNLHAAKRSAVLAVASIALEDVGLGGDARKNADVRVFLNRIFGLPVMRQNLIFSLYMSTLEDIITEAKARGEYEGSAEDIKASSIEIANEKTLTVDASCGAKTKLTTLFLDRGISFSTVYKMALETSGNRGGPSEATQKTSLDWRDRMTKHIAPSGFYKSRNRIAGRHLILYAARKNELSSFKSEREAKEFDPLGLMIVTRPNTGTNTSDMSTRDLKAKYTLLLSCDELQILPHKASEQKDNEQTSEEPSEKGKETCNVVEDTARNSDLSSYTTSCAREGSDAIIDDSLSVSTEDLVTKHKPQIAQLWNAAYKESNNFDHQNGLAPRRAKLCLVTGAVLHILPALEKAVVMRSAKERSLKIMRAAIPSLPAHQRRLVGVRFPTDEGALQALQNELAEMNKEQKNADRAFLDENIQEICPKAMKFATSERKTIKSFFSAIASSSGSSKNVGKAPKPSGTKRRFLATTSKATVPVSSKKSKSIASFFVKKSS